MSEPVPYVGEHNPNAKSSAVRLLAIDVFGFINSMDNVGTIIHNNAVAHGWWEGDRNDGELIALIHSEVSEALEGLRHGNPPSEHIPEFSAAEEELADAIIRILDHAKARGWRIPEAILAKHEFNLGRAYKHGKQF